MNKRAIAALFALLILAGGIYIHHKNKLEEANSPIIFETRIRDEYASAAISYFEENMTFSDEDIVTVYEYEGQEYIDSFTICTHESAERFFDCIRNCESIYDYTGSDIQTMALPIQLNGCDAHGGQPFDACYLVFPDTGQFVGFHFTERDSEALYQYAMDLAHEQP